MLKKTLNSLLDFIFIDIGSIYFRIFDRYCLHRLQFAHGRAALANVKNKGNNVLMHGYGKIIFPDRLAIGDHVRLGTNCHLNCAGGVKIGANTQISRDVVIYSSNHDYLGTAIPYDNNFVKREVTIGRSVWIGMGVFILPGVSIGDGAIIGMGTVVSKDVPSMAIVVGAEQKIIKSRSKEDFDDLDTKQLWFGKLFPEA